MQLKPFMQFASNAMTHTHRKYLATVCKY